MLLSRPSPDASFNEFFYRKLKPDARPCTAPDNPNIVVSPADCRSVVFNKIDKAKEVWIKGRDFTVQRLLGPAYPDDAAKFEGGALGIFFGTSRLSSFSCPCGRRVGRAEGG
jgi:phosphatidylserine decarboxylase